MGARKNNLIFFDGVLLNLNSYAAFNLGKKNPTSMMPGS